MRILKFRAWDSKKQTFPFVGFHIIGETTAFDLIKQYQLEELNDLTISQFTGCTDRKQKDVYEGDVVEVEICGYNADGDEFSEFIRAEVMFVEGQWKIENSDAYFEGPLFENLHRIEVIGNTFENPNILCHTSNQTEEKNSTAQ